MPRSEQYKRERALAATRRAEAAAAEEAVERLGGAAKVPVHVGCAPLMYNGERARHARVHRCDCTVWRVSTKTWRHVMRWDPGLGQWVRPAKGEVRWMETTRNASGNLVVLVPRAENRSVDARFIVGELAREET